MLASPLSTNFARSIEHPYFEWEPRTRRYRNKATGRFLSPQVVSVLTQQRIEQIKDDLQQVGDLLLTGKISLDTWQRQTAAILKILHAQQFLLAVGGASAIQKEDYLTIGRQLKSQYSYLRNFAVDCQSGTMTTAQFRARVNLYANSSKGSFFAGQRTAARKAGKTYGIRQLGDTKHCLECEQYAARGLTPIDETILPTEKCSCGANCACTVLFTTLEEALKINFQVEYQEQIEFSTGEYVVDKNGRWRDKNGRFIDMPDINDPEIKSNISERIKEGKGTEARNVIKDISKLKLLDLKTPQAYKATVDTLKRKYKNNPFALSVISSLQLEKGVSNKNNSLNKIKELEKLLKDGDNTETKKPSLNQKLRNIELSEVAIGTDANLNRLEKELESKTGDQAIKDKTALNSIKQYRQAVQDLNAVLTEAKSKAELSDEDYDRLYSTREKVWSDMKGALDTVQKIKDSYLSDPVLDNYVDTLRRVSREAIGGFKIVVPQKDEGLKEKAKAMPC